MAAHQITGFECHPDETHGIEQDIDGNKTYFFGIVCVVVEEGVCLQLIGGDFARAPWYVIPGRGLHQSNGQWGSSRPATRTSLGAALFVPCRPRDRMGLSCSSRKHARQQLERHVYRTS